jgi:mannosyltransferase OCH1-like enzyme
MASWAAHHPDWEIERFDNASALAFMTAHMPDEVVRAFRAASNPAMRADLFRLAWLLARGGVYADADDRCHMALDPLLRPGTELLLYLEDWASIGNNVMAATPGHAIIAAAMHQVAEAVLRGDRDFVWLCTGPALMTRTVAAAVAQERGMPCGVRLLRRWEMHRHVAMHAQLAYKGSKRHWLRAAFAPANSHRSRA